jgi:hypothetical protein
MKDKDSLILENLYNKVVEEAKTKSKKQVGYLLSDKVSPLTSKQKKKLKKELHSGEVKVKNESSRPIGGSGEESEVEFNWTHVKDPDIAGHWFVYYDYNASGSRSSATYDEPSSSDINVEVEYVRIEKFNEYDDNDDAVVVYDGSPYVDLPELKVSNPRIYKLVRSVIESKKEREMENEDNYDDYEYEGPDRLEDY